METKCTFPDDLVGEILSWLAVRQLLRFRRVSKSWCAIVDNPTFINKHHEKQYAILKEEGDIPLLFYNYTRFYRDSTQFHILSKRYGDVLLSVTHDLKRDSASLSPAIMKHFNRAECHGCANGVVLLERWNSADKGSYLGLWNPTTGEFKFVPPRRPRLSKGCRSDSTLGFDPNSNDMKIIRFIYRYIVSHEGYNSFEMCEMYSLNTNSWKNIEYPSHPEHHLEVGPDGTGVYINNIHYWPYNNVRYPGSYDHIPDRERSSCILSFDFCNEMFCVLSLPPIEVRYWSLVNHNGSLAFIYSPDDQKLQTEFVQRFEIWVMTEGNDHSWKHLFTIGPFPFRQRAMFLWSDRERATFLSFRVGGDILITPMSCCNHDPCSVEGIHYDNRVTCLYDLAAKKITKRFEFEFGERFEYVESLFKLSK